MADHFSEKAVGGDIQPEPGLVEKEEALAEWSLLRSLMSTAYRANTCGEFVCKLLDKHNDTFSALSVIASAAAVIPVTNASAE